MKEISREWIEYAENDLSAAEQIFQSNLRSPNEIICFHCQQCIEKYLKALLIEHDIYFEKTHDLDRLLNLLLPVLPELELHRAGLNELTNYATDTRYPSDIPTPRSTTQHALSLTREIREILRLQFQR